ncbi:protein phosphatase [Sphaerotilus hippei]|uniref:Protein phosphatase n=1 Tax=Sphaerotilus hippei TaxID=744406 RepID=A0A318H6I5_9BURK|nr:Stp1/IreP family PP2C-type Ser/Thr phosphatase [Sphaerotilus hippei]PXW99485.1 protein phosphatase [Sphaerotilus hippei]
MNIEFYAVTDTGRARLNNEDSVAIEENAGLVVLADGMGGYNAGEVASHMATEYIRSELGYWLKETGTEASDLDVRRAMDICVDNANRAIFNAANANAQYAGMGTTLVVGVLRGSRLLLGHIGDSRAYRWRDGRLVQLTRDHSLLQEQLDAGLITPEQALYSSHRNLVTRAVGVEDVVLLETHIHPVLPQDWFLLCSDGLSDMLTDEQIGEVLVAHGEAASAADALVEAANQAGGRDNIAVILIATQSSADGARSWWPFKR